MENSKKTLKFKIIALLVVVAVVIGFISVLVPYTIWKDVKAIKTSELWFTSDGIRVEDNGQLSLENKKSGLTTYKNILYANNAFGGDSAKGLTATVKNTSADFENLTLKFTSKPGQETKVLDITHKVILSKGANGKMFVKIDDGENGLDDKEEAVAFSNIDFLNSEIKIAYGISTGGKPQIVIASGDNVKFSKELKYAIKDSSTKFEVEFNGVETGKKASCIVSELNSQSLVQSGDAIQDTVALKAVVAKEKLGNTEQNVSDCYIVGTNTNVQVPIQYYDVLNSNIKPTVKIAYSSSKDGEYTELSEKDAKINGTKFYVGSTENRYYRVTLTAKKNASSTDEIKNVIYYKAIKDTVAPTLDISGFSNLLQNASGEPIEYPAGEEFQFPYPSVQSSNSADNSYNLDYHIFYKNATAVEFVDVTGLKFVPSVVGRYTFKFMAIDRNGNKSSFTDEINLEFRDRTAPKMTITNFLDEAYVNQENYLPSADVSDSVDSSVKKDVKLYYVEEGKDDETIELDGYKFTPTKKGTYKAVYSAVDSAMNRVEEVRTFEVVDAKASVKPLGDYFSAWTITFIVIGSVALIGIIVLLIIRPRRSK